MATTALRHAALRSQRATLPQDLRDATTAQRVACACWLLAQASCPVCASADTEEPCGCTAQVRWAAYRAQQLTSC